MQINGGFTMNIPLFSAVFSIVATFVVGVLMVVLFVNDWTSAQTVLGAVAVGVIASIPFSVFVTKRMSAITGNPNQD